MTNSPAVGSDPRSAADTPYHRMSSSNEPALRPLFDRNVQQGPTQRLIGGPNDGPPRLFGSATWNQIVPGTAGTGNDIINSNNGGNGGPGGGGGGRTGRGAAWNMDQLVQAAIRLMGLNHAMVRDILIQILLLVAGLAFVFTGDLRSAGICLLLYYAWYLYLQLTYGLAQHLLQNGPPPGGGLRAPCGRGSGAKFSRLLTLKPQSSIPTLRQHRHHPWQPHRPWSLPREHGRSERTRGSRNKRERERLRSSSSCDKYY
mmetsp:Transcript_8748/g.21262  ORF Transcript_8748/g.21262 Transcript_8748/m.21262 type:complete len:258 (+) Transcript_8748:804-1577(+)